MITNKLDINGEYLIFTNYQSIIAKKMKVVGILNYEKAKALPFSLHTMAINEKVVDTEKDDTMSYLENLTYYHCVSKNDTGDEEVFVIWDDIIDFNKTTKLSIKYEYTLSLDIGNDLVSDINTVENSILTYINKTYGNNVVPKLVSLGTSDTIEDPTVKELNKYKEMIQSAIRLADKLASLKQIESLIEYFAKDDMYAKIENITNTLNEISDNVSIINRLVR